ncbi:MAG TPA: hypothetical protein VH413_14825 [Verrucomicrobiae bacterium]|jgi:hypothetical protein|nr:hypothetical protein [Verrucomicrobiae bacterium]
MKRILLLFILLFPLATLLFWIWEGVHNRTTLPHAAVDETNFPATATHRQ